MNITLTTRKPKFRPTNPKEQGEYAEMRFQVDGTENGLFLSKPYGDSRPYDFIADNLRRLIRVQVKSVNVLHQSAYYAKVNSQRKRKLRPFTRKAPRRYELRYMVSMQHAHRSRAYRRSEIDFVAILVIPENVWYIIPVRLVEGRTAVSVFPHNPHSRGMFERYKNAWHLLR